MYNYWTVDYCVNSWMDICSLSGYNQFWPVKSTKTRSPSAAIDNNNFCRRLTVDGDGVPDGLSASAPTITKDAIMQVQELVLDRKMSNVKYQMEYGRIFNEQPYLAGSSKLTNNLDEEASMAVSITYADEMTSTFTGGFSLTGGCFRLYRSWRSLHRESNDYSQLLRNCDVRVGH
ncbi:uncharacterized protein LOC131000374 [Salvia miltiorrhiza]|uniref:uncharacterized protein LOC131000374 n=1 Tax=Salvia miltiorrhiza TaxID=226208 RepID=UPI0025AB6056|nr:uncharacterized protein LOC131000374 [Salvia miltiorrhiza]XP_057782231.1 uncharacterized protein LOC131000374 [Salvia miltiorrhiza]